MGIAGAMKYRLTSAREEKMLDPKVYPILSRAEAFKPGEVELFMKALTQTEKEQIKEESEMLIKSLGDIIDPAWRIVAKAIDAFVPVLREWFDSLPQEERNKLLSKGDASNG